MRFLKYLLYLSLTILIISFSLTTSDDLSQDLGRHLKLGEIISQTKSIPKTNLFSYTHPNFEFVNHHWLSEVLFYNIQKSFGLDSLIILKTAIFILSLLIVFHLAVKKSNIIAASAITLLFVPLFLERQYIRPEVFGYLFFSAILYVLFNFRKNEKLLFLLPLILGLWVNIHITFVFGVFLTLLIGLKIYSAKDKSSKNLGIIFLSLLVLLLNPNFIKGALYPLFIFGNYGYAVAENQNLFFLDSVIHNPLIKYFFVISPVFIVSFIMLFAKKRVFEGVILLTFFILSCLQIRHLPFLLLAAIPTVSPIINYLFEKKIKLSVIYQKISIGFLITLSLLMSFYFTSNKYYRTFDINRKFGIGTYEEAKKAADFLIKNRLQSNLFNNFNIGGYLVYRLYPQYKVFIDNRPEAYPEELIKNTYIKTQEDDTIRKTVFEKYNINTVFFAHLDITPWAEQFMKNIYQDKDWKVVYLDSYVIILTKNTRFNDLRDNPGYFETMIDGENDYLRLIRLIRFLGFIKEERLMEKAFNKAASLNPDSCSIKRLNYFRLQNSPLFYQRADELRKESWWCFKKS